MRALFRHMRRPANLLTAARVAAVVGSALNLINQGPALLRPDTLHWGHLLLNYAVPFAVASYSAGKAQLIQERGIQNDIG